MTIQLFRAPLRATLFLFAMLALPAALHAQTNGLPAKDVVLDFAVDFDQDGMMDRLIFTAEDGAQSFADLHVFQGIRDAATGKDGFRLLSKTEEFGFGVNRAVEKKKGVIAISSAQAQGRNKWEQTLTIAWRGGKLMVIGITYSSYDSIGDSDRDYSRCDLNLATGKGTGKKGQAIRVALKPVPVAEWTDDKLPEVCNG